MGRRSGEPGDDWYSKNCAFGTLMISMVGMVGTALVLIVKRRSDHD